MPAGDPDPQPAKRRSRPGPRSHARLPLALIGLLALPPGSGRAAPEPDAPSAEPPYASTLPARARLQLRSALALRDDSVRRPDRRIRAHGQAPSQLLVDGTWLAATRPLGVAAHLEGQRFALRGEDPVSGPFDSVATALEGSAGLVARRLAWRDRLSLEGQMGYALGRYPVAQVRDNAPAGAMPVAASAFVAHGPALGARVAFAAAETVTVETGARLRPISFGARVDGADLSLRSFAAGATVAVGAVSGPGFRLAGLLGYEFSLLDARGGGREVRQLQHSIGIGLLAAFLSPPARVPAPAPIAPAPALSVRGVVHGVVRAAQASAAGPAGAPLSGVTVSVSDGPSSTTDGNGAFTLSGLAPGMASLHLSGPGLLPGEEVLVIPAEGEVSVDLELRPAEAARLATITGLVRGDDGKPLAARVSVVELDLVSQADARGRFRLELPAGRYTLVIEAPGLTTQRKAVRVGAGEHSIYNLDLQREP